MSLPNNPRSHHMETPTIPKSPFLTTKKVTFSYWTMTKPKKKHDLISDLNLPPPHFGWLPPCELHSFQLSSFFFPPELWDFKSGVEALLGGKSTFNTLTHTKWKELKDKRHLHMEAGENSGAQQWLCTRSAYSIFHHYGGKKNPLAYWSAPLLPCLSASLVHPLLITSFIPAFNPLAQKFASITRLFFSGIDPSSKQGHKLAEKSREMSCTSSTGTDEKVGWTQTTPAQSNAIQRSGTAINILFERNVLESRARVQDQKKKTAFWSYMTSPF